MLELAPQKLHKTFTLTEASSLATKFGAETLSDLARLRPQLTAEDRLDVQDPIGKSADIFATVGAQIAHLLPPIIDLARRG